MGSRERLRKIVSVRLQTVGHTQAVEREGLEVGTVFAMHQGPMPWGQMVSLIEKSQHPAV